jgi:hypothetical protein
MRPFFLACGLVAVLAACTTTDDITVLEQGGGKYTLTVENDFTARVQGGERLLGRKAEAICPDGYDRLRRRSIHKKHGVTDYIAWDIECS